MGNDLAIANNLQLAKEVAKVAGLPQVTAAANNASPGMAIGTSLSYANKAAYSTADAFSDKVANAFESGLRTFVDQAASLKSSNSPKLSLIGDVVTIANDFATGGGFKFDNFLDLAADALATKLVVNITNANPAIALISKVGVVATISKTILKETGLGSLLGPVGGALNASADVVIGVSDGLNIAIKGFATAAVDTAVNIGSTLVHVAENLGDLTEDLFTGDWNGAANAAQRIATDLANDVIAIGTGIADDLVATANSLIDTAMNIANSLVTAWTDLMSGFVSIANIISDGFVTIGNAFSDAWSDIESIY
jgi:hypothetical protein